MWSDVIDYYEIRSAGPYVGTAKTEVIKAQFDKLPEIQRQGLIEYKGIGNYIGISFCLIKGNNGNYALDHDTWTEEFNMIPIICAKSENGKTPQYHISFLIRLARILNWELINEENDAGEENVILWQPQ
ncbi:hypothetical protein MUN82_00920 [Hymenobacter aerilatus]|uniref:Uncharacterized protein n=1 Tax=Hymenobacter aerilatus TaxID=2932251 RepID=A0A8T9T0Q9_9BACT|nr:hypothetical protein [Hymenobacter aerilatus]UOR05676.1 hypothetical protein MUN82_00920 [Hymenobacter aerilatus]